MPIRAFLLTHRFRPHWLATLATLMLSALFIHLGLWQAGKAQRQTALQATLTQRLAAAPQPLPLIIDTQVETLRYLRVRLRGHYDAAHTLLLDNQIHDGRAGFHVITPLHLEDGRIVLVNRGWVPFSGDRLRLPSIDTPDGLQTVLGHLIPPAPHRLAAEFLPAPGTWPRLWPALDLARIRLAAGPILPVLVRMEADSPGGGYLRTWSRPDERVAMHQSYALQWSLLTTALILAWIWFGFRPATTQENPS